MKLSKSQKDTILDEMKKKHFNHKQSNGVDIYFNKAINEGIEVKGTDVINPFVMSDLERVYGYDQVGNETRTAVSIIEQILMEDAKELVDKEQEAPTQEVETKEADIVPLPTNTELEMIGPVFGVVPEYLTDALIAKHPGTISTLISMQKTAANVIKTREKGLKYVDTAYMTVALNWATLMEWSFEILETREDEIEEYDSKKKKNVIKKHYSVLGCVTMHTTEGKTIMKQQWGSQVLKAKMEVGDALKAAASDSMKKCASMFGIAADVYGGNV